MSNHTEEKFQDIEDEWDVLMKARLADGGSDIGITLRDQSISSYCRKYFRALLEVAKTGCAWRDLMGFGPLDAVAYYGESFDLEGAQKQALEAFDIARKKLLKI
jgi:hypothetical protein